MEKEIIKLVDVCKMFDGHEALSSINLSVHKNEFLTLLGPSGCGKTTTLRIIGGFDAPTSGKVFLDGRDMSLVPPYKRRVNTVFQKYALFPHMNVEENIAFGLKIKKLPADEIREKVNAMLDMVNLAGFNKRSTESLSGGQQQRVAIARALVNEPEVLLLDEPLGALDLKLRKEMQVELKRIQKRLGITFVYVTHDQEEALSMSDTIIVMHNGEILQKGTPVDIYNEPANAFVAKFIGESNILKGTMVRDYYVEFLGLGFECVDKGFAENEPCDVVIRPEDIEVVDKEQAKIRGIVESVTFKGVHYEIMVASEGFTFMIHSTLCQEVGKEVGLTFIPYNIHIMKRGQEN